VYIRNKIFNARTGVLLCEGGNNGLGYAPGVASSVAADFDGDTSDLELAAGYTVYEVDITNPNGQQGNRMIPHNISIKGKYRDGPTAMGDINGDGVLDIIVHHEEILDKSHRLAILYVYTFHKGKVKFLAKVNLPPNKWNILNSQHWLSIPAVGVIDRTNKISIIIVRGDKLIAYYFDGSTTLEVKWVKNILDGSAATGAVLYDIDGDHINEIIHRDEKYLRVIKDLNSKPIVIDSATCYAGTAFERPLVADLFNNGNAHILTTCNSNKLLSLGRLTIFGSPDSLGPWAPARRLWNQFGYHITNINDDLTVDTTAL